MQRLINNLIACVFLFLIVQSAEGQHCGVSGGYATGYSGHAVQNYNYGHAQNYNQAVQYNIIELPLYSAGYSAGGDPYALLEVAKQLKELNGNIQNFNLVSANAKAAADASVISNDAGNKFVNLLASDCAACHTGSRAKGGFQIFSDNNQLTLSCEAVLKIVDRAYLKGDMPPRSTYSDEQKKIVIEGVSFYLENQK